MASSFDSFVQHLIPSGDSMKPVAPSPLAILTKSCTFTESSNVSKLSSQDYNKSPLTSQPLPLNWVQISSAPTSPFYINSIITDSDEFLGIENRLVVDSDSNEEIEEETPPQHHIPPVPSISSNIGSNTDILPGSLSILGNSINEGLIPNHSPSPPQSPSPPPPTMASSSSASSSALRAQHRRRATSRLVTMPGSTPLKQIPLWSSLTHIGVIHRQGIQPPELVVKLVRDQRPYFHLLIPPNPDSTEEYLGIYARKKRKKNICRMSLNPNNMTKKHNPKYVGKVQALDDGLNSFEVVHDDRSRIAVLHFSHGTSASSQKSQFPNLEKSGKSSKNQKISRKKAIRAEKKAAREAAQSLGSEKLLLGMGKGLNIVTRNRSSNFTHLTCQLLEGCLNQRETGPRGNLLKGHIQRYVQPMLTLKLDHPSHRPVFVVHRVEGGDLQSMTGSNKKISVQLENNKYLISFDYPVTLFLAFSIFLALEWDVVSRFR